MKTTIQAYMSALDERFDKLLHTDPIVRTSYDLVMSQLLLSDEITQQTRREYALKLALVMTATARSELMDQVAGVIANLPIRLE